MVTLFVTDRQRTLPLNHLDLADSVDLILRKYRAKAGDIALHFVEPGEIGSLHRRYFGDPAPTDCISFPLSEGSKLEGDIFICPKVGLEFAGENGLDPYDEVYRYLVHALLHFLGFGDRTPSERAEMTRREDGALGDLNSRGYHLRPI